MRKNINVIAKFSEDGTVTPLYILWDEIRIYEIDKVLDIRKRASTRGGGMGLRYLCRIKNQERFIWLDDYTWFLEV